MNIVVFTEGKGDRKVYKSWIPFVNNQITLVNRIDEIIQNNYAVILGFGYPSYFDDIRGVIQQVNSHGSIDRLVICIDSEDMTLSQKRQEMTTFLSAESCNSPVFVVYQHFCLETWALANRNVCSANANHQSFQTFKQFFNVLTHDPENLPGYPLKGWNRAQFAETYLKAMLQASNTHSTYNKSRPTPLLNQKYFQEVLLRHTSTSHIPSFVFFLNAFV